MRATLGEIMSAPMIPFSLDSGRMRERSRRLLSKHFYAITGIRDWILSKRLQLQEITRVSPYAIRAPPPAFELLEPNGGESKSAIHFTNFHRKTWRNATDTTVITIWSIRRGLKFPPKKIRIFMDRKGMSSISGFFYHRYFYRVQ